MLTIELRPSEGDSGCRLATTGPEYYFPVGRPRAPSILGDSAPNLLLDLRTSSLEPMCPSHALAEMAESDGTHFVNDLAGSRCEDLEVSRFIEALGVERQSVSLDLWKRDDRLCRGLAEQVAIRSLGALAICFYVISPLRITRGINALGNAFDNNRAHRMARQDLDFLADLAPIRAIANGSRMCTMPSSGLFSVSLSVTSLVRCSPGQVSDANGIPDLDDFGLTCPRPREPVASAPEVGSGFPLASGRHLFDPVVSGSRRF